MECVTSGLSKQSYRVGPALLGLGEGFYRGFVDSHEVTLRLASTIDRAAVAALEAEAALIEQLNNRQIATLLDRGRTEKYCFLVLDGPAEPSLAELIGETNISVLPALTIALRVLDTLEVLHRHGIFWGCLSPHAFWIDRLGRVKLMNLRGFVQPWASRRLSTTAATYLAPECSSGAPPIPESDLYAWGVLVFELLAGRPPFVGASVVELVVKHLGDPPPDLAGMHPGLPADLVALVERCLSKLPAERPASIADTRNELEQIYRRLFAEQQARMIVCPRCECVIPRGDRCPLCQAPINKPAPPAVPPRRRVGLLTRIAGLAVIVGVIALPQLQGQKTGAAPASSYSSAAQAQGTAVSVAVRAAVSPVPTATAAPTPLGMLDSAAKDVVDPNIDLVRARAALEGDQVVAELAVVGRIYEHMNEATYQFFLDTDGNPATGGRDGPWPALGADYVVLYRSGEEAAMLLRWNGTAWQGTRAVAAEVSAEKLRLRIPAAWLGQPANLQFGALADNPIANLTDYAPARPGNDSQAAS